MTRDELIEAISADAEITQAAAAAALRAFCDHVGAALAAGEEVRLIGFGRFEAHVSPAGWVRNPRTGAPIAVGPRARARFHMGAELGRRLAPLADRRAERTAAA